MRIDRHGRLMKQITVWIEVDQYDLLKMDGINVSEFIRDQIAGLFEDTTVSRHEARQRLEQSAREIAARARSAAAEREAARERARDNIRHLRADRDAASARHGSILEALYQIVGDDSTGRYLRTVPENDPHGDRMDDWDALVRRVSRLCGAEIDSAEVAAGLRALVARA